MKTTLGVVIAVAAMMFEAGFANAAVSGNVAALRALSTQSSPAETVGYVHQSVRRAGRRTSTIRMAAFFGPDYVSADARPHPIAVPSSSGTQPRSSKNRQSNCNVAPALLIDPPRQRCWRTQDANRGRLRRLTPFQDSGDRGRVIRSLDSGGLVRCACSQRRP